MNKSLFTFVSLLIFITNNLSAKDILSSVEAIDDKYKAIYVVRTPENPYKKTPEIRITAEDVLSKLGTEHPRMFCTKKQMKALRSQFKTDVMLQKYVKQVLHQADKIRQSTDKKDEKQFMDDMLTLGFAYHWTGDAGYAEKATEFMKHSCSATDWGFHFLSVADAALTIGMGYDLFYNYFDKPTKDLLRYGGIIRNGLNPGIAAYEGAPTGWFKDVHHNWNLVCNTAMIISSLAIAENDSFDFYPGKIVPAAVKSMVKAMNEYALDGAFPEGTGYWGYATSRAILAMEAMQNCLNTDFGLSGFEGFNKTYYFRWHLTAPNGTGATFADCTPGWPVRPEGLSLWLGKKFNDARLVNYEHNLLAESKRNATVYHLLYYCPTKDTTFAALPLDAYFKGPVEIATMRTEWNNPDALFVNIKAGYNQVNHGHLDLGRFEYYNLGECWFTELGKEEYGLPDYFDMHSKRWTYFRAGSLSHNVPLIDEKNQNVYGTTHFSGVNINQPVSSVKIDLSDAYKNQSKTMFRELTMDKNAKTVAITDSYDLLRKSTISWRGITDAKIQLNGDKAILERNGKKIQVRILSPRNAKFVVESAEQKPPLKENKGFKVLKVESVESAGNKFIKVEIAVMD